MNGIADPMADPPRRDVAKAASLKPFLMRLLKNNRNFRLYTQSLSRLAQAL